MTHKLQIIFLACLWHAGIALAGGTYRWVDENGVTVYSQIPPPGGKPATRIKPPPPPPDENKSWEKLDLQWQAMEDRREKDREKMRRQQNQAQIQREQQRNCAAARHNLKILQGPARKKILGANGQYRHPTAEERQREIKATMEKIRKNCKEL